MYAIYQIGGYPYLCRKNGAVCEFIKMEFSNGTILKETTVELSWRSQVQALENGIVIYDSGEGKVVALDSDLPTGNRETLLKNMEDWHTIGKNETYVNFYYTDSAEQTIKYVSLNLQTSELDEIPFKEKVAYLYREGETWLGRSHLVEERYMICRENDAVRL